MGGIAAAAGSVSTASVVDIRCPLASEIATRRPAGDSFRGVQLTPPGSACSIRIGTGISDAEPGSIGGLHLVVPDLERACSELRGRGVDVGEIHHFESGRPVSGPDPDARDYGSFSSFADPDGNTWVLQEVDRGRHAAAS